MVADRYRSILIPRRGLLHRSQGGAHHTRPNLHPAMHWTPPPASAKSNHPLAIVRFNRTIHLGFYDHLSPLNCLNADANHSGRFADTHTGPQKLQNFFVLPRCDGPIIFYFRFFCFAWLNFRFVFIFFAHRNPISRKMPADFPEKPSRKIEKNFWCAKKWLDSGQSPRGRWGPGGPATI